MNMDGLSAIEKLERDLFIKEMCARQPYGVRVYYWGPEEEMWCNDLIDCIELFPNGEAEFSIGQYGLRVGQFKPILRTLDSMTAEERREMGEFIKKNCIPPFGEIKDSGTDNLLLSSINGAKNLMHWLYLNHFDINNLIPRGLAYNKDCPLPDKRPDPAT